MTKKELYSVRRLKVKVASFESYILNLRLSVQDLVPVNDGLPHSQEVKSRVETLALKLVEETEKLSCIKNQLELAKTNLAIKIFAEVDSPVLQQVALLRYVQCHTYKDISILMRRTLRWIFKLHERFLKKYVSSY